VTRLNHLKDFAKRRWDLLALLPLCAVLLYLQLKYSGYIKDDTYIALRYSRNLAEGHGMVFNYGQRLEGYTDFLWIVLTVPSFWLGIDPVVWVKGLACLAGQAGLFVTYAIARHFGGDRTDAYNFAAAVVWSCSASVVLWSMAGMEPTLMAVLCSGGMLAVMKLWEARDEPDRARRLAWWAGLLLAAGALCRPEGHAVVLLAAGIGVLDAVRQKKLPRSWLLCAGIIAGLLIPYHFWRVLYFGAWLPNTYLAKASAGSEVWQQGMGFAKELLGFEVNPAVFGLAVVSLALGWKRWFSRLIAAGLALFFLAYMVKIGRDEMKWFRLYLPVYPLAVALGADGLRQLGQGALRLARQVEDRAVVRGRVAHMVAVVLVVIISVPTFKICFDFALKHDDRHTKYLKWSEDSFQEMGRHVDLRSAPGEVAVFQDMGAAPFAAGDIRWVDTIGILDENVSHELATTGVNPFMRGAKRKLPGGREALRDMDKRLRDYFFAQEPSWIAFVGYVPKNKRRKLWKQWKRIDGELDEEEKLLLPYYRNNGHSHYLAKDSRFKEGFHYVGAWDRNNHGYWIVLYRANDHIDVRDR
jgi:hypothetical protein